MVDGHDRRQGRYGTGVEAAYGPSALPQGVGWAASWTTDISKKAPAVAAPGPPTMPGRPGAGGARGPGGGGPPPPAVTAAAQSAVKDAAAKAAISAVDKTVTDARAAAEANVITSTALGVTAIALGFAGRAAAHPMGRVATRVVVRNPVARAANAFCLDVAVRTASTPAAQAAIDATLDAMLDTAIAGAVDGGGKTTREPARPAAREAVRGAGPAVTSQGAALAESTPVTSAAADLATLTAARAT